ncbi:hypothetical protein PROFUN_08514 [Planoprotostelium fungivorum]|uniref:Uncharacterized protein n=1 Tax=Planoprotostelium fungivorum TaxID=1890364 RepID=A0A2P6NJD7_9EUKA|nr:hypothetical protein PROFUN_08514 [Planoprotostelium fungivorum]
MDGYIVSERIVEDAVNTTIDLNLEDGTIHIKRGGSAPRLLYRMIDDNSDDKLRVLHPSLHLQSGLQHRMRCRVIRAIQMNKIWSTRQKEEALCIVDRIKLLESKSLGDTKEDLWFFLQKTCKFTVEYKDGTAHLFAFRYSVWKDNEECPSKLSCTLSKSPHIVEIADTELDLHFDTEVMKQLQSKCLNEGDVKWLLLHVFKCAHLIDHEMWKAVYEDNTIDVQQVEIGRTEELVDVLGHYLNDFAFSYEDEPSEALKVDSEPTALELYEEGIGMSDQRANEVQNGSQMKRKNNKRAKHEV